MSTFNLDQEEIIKMKSVWIFCSMFRGNQLAAQLRESLLLSRHQYKTYIE